DSMTCSLSATLTGDRAAPILHTSNQRIRMFIPRQASPFQKHRFKVRIPNESDRFGALQYPCDVQSALWQAAPATWGAGTASTFVVEVMQEPSPGLAEIIGALQPQQSGPSRAGNAFGRASGLD